MLPPSKRSDVASFIAMDIMREANALAAEGRSIMRLEVGQPALAAPEAVRRAAADALEKDRLGYTDALGVPALKERIAGHYGEAYGVSADPAQVIVTAGSSGGFVLAFLACFEPGAKVGLAEPGYPAYRNILKALGIEPVGIPIGPETGWQLDVETVRAAEKKHGRLAGLLVASPANPTGTMQSPASLADLIADCEEKGRWFISDEIYHGITYETPAVSACGRGDHVVVINSFSKYYCMTGWRLGWLVLPPALVRTVERLAQNLFISPPSLSQFAALEAFGEHEELDRRVAAYRTNRNILLEGLPQIGISEIAPADGAFYLYADVSGLTDNAIDFCRDMLEEASVAATPGLDFDPVRGRSFVRFSYAGAAADMEEAIRRLKAWV